MYVATFVESVYVLHCFTKKTQKTSRIDNESSCCGIKKSSKKGVLNMSNHNVNNHVNNHIDTQSRHFTEADGNILQTLVF